MKKFNEFTTNNDIKLPIHEKKEFTHKYEEIQAQKVHVNNANFFSKGFDNLYENRHIDMEEELTHEWILDKFTLSTHADGQGRISFFADEKSKHWIELSLNALDIEYNKEDLVISCDNVVVVSFELDLDKLKNKCPTLHHKLYLLNALECVNQQFLQSIGNL